MKIKLVGSFFFALGWLIAASGAEPKPINVAAGEEFKIELQSDSSTGCQWLLSKPLDEKLLKSITGKPYKSTRGKSGTMGVETLTYKALAEGKTVIHLKYDKLWEKTAAPLRVTNFVVVISPQKAR